MRWAACMLMFVTACVAQNGRFVNEQYDLQKIGEGVYSFIAPDSDSGVVQSNCTLIIGENSALVVDSGQFPTLAERMVADIKKLTSKPVRYLVNTHWHFDHVWGNGVFSQHFPGLTIISTGFTRDMVEAEGPKTIVKQPSVNLQQAADIRNYAAKGKTSDGKDLPEDYKVRLLHSADTLEHINAEFPLTKHTPPNLTFTKEIEIDLGHRIVKVMWLGRANTGGDAEVWVPDVKLLLTGDTVVAPIPFAFGSYMSEWPAVLQQMIDLHAAIIIPGHGAVMYDNSYLLVLKEMIQQLSSEVEASVAKGASLEQIRKELTLDDFATRLYGNDRIKKREFSGTFLEPGINRAHQEATGTMKPEGMDE